MRNRDRLALRSKGVPARQACSHAGRTAAPRPARTSRAPTKHSRHCGSWSYALATSPREVDAPRTLTVLCLNVPLKCTKESYERHERRHKELDSQLLLLSSLFRPRRRTLFTWLEVYRCRYTSGSGPLGRLEPCFRRQSRELHT